MTENKKLKVTDLPEGTYEMKCTDMMYFGESMYSAQSIGLILEHEGEKYAHFYAFSLLPIQALATKDSTKLDMYTKQVNQFRSDLGACGVLDTFALIDPDTRVQDPVTGTVDRPKPLIGKTIKLERTDSTHLSKKTGKPYRNVRLLGAK